MGGRPIVQAITTTERVLVYYVYLVDNPYIYGELSIFVPIFLLRETHAEVIYLYFSFFQIEVSYINISHNFRICAIFLISVTIFEAVKGYHKVCIEILKQRTTLHLLFVGH